MPATPPSCTPPARPPRTSLRPGDRLVEFLLQLQHAVGLVQDRVVAEVGERESYAGDTAFLHAACSAAANVILADAEIDEDEIEIVLHPPGPALRPGDRLVEFLLQLQHAVGLVQDRVVATPPSCTPPARPPRT
jgi:hypothetical protein